MILTGDFNVNADARSGNDRNTYDALFSPRSPKLVDTTKGSAEGMATFSNWAAGATQGRRIDWIAVSDSLKVQRAEIDRTQQSGKTPSDHFPVIAIVRRTK